MPRYFIEVSYKGTRYSGFQVQRNANTIQSELEKALEIFFRKAFTLTGSSRTDAGVHALQNYFHFDSHEELFDNPGNSFENNTGLRKSLYSLNSILPEDIVIHNIGKVKNSAHSRYDAVSRQYKYQLYQSKNPFYKDIAYYYPYSIDIRKLQLAAEIIVNTNDFKSFSKRKTQVNNFICSIHESDWIIENDLIIYNVVGNRFLRGMVRGLVGTMLKVGSGKIRLQQFEEIIKNRDCTKADFSVPPQGLFLVKVIYPHDVFVI
ncbi:MAG: tRNA pseudouridine(38-40) synthase TruA [Ginsengibacter sp.]